MSGSDTAAAVMTSTEPFPAAKPPVAAPQPVIQSMRLAYSSDGTPVYKPLATTPPPSYPSAGVSSGGAAEATAAAPSPVLPHNLNVNVGESMRKKRGRPRKYGPDGNMALALMTVSPPGSAPHPHPTGTFSPSPQSHVSGGGLASPVSSGSSLKKARGRPPGSSKKQQMESLGSAGLGFTPHVINVKTGEDVSSKIMSFSQNGPRAVCILSANGAISNVTLRQAATSGGTATYEGRFDILSLSGSFLLTEVGGQRSRTGGLSVSLAGPDGRVLGGSVAGLLTAASPVQVIVGSFVVDGRKDPKPAAIHVEPLSAAAPKLAQSVVGAAAVVHSPQSHGSLSESSGGSGSPLNQSTGAYNNHHHNNNNQPHNMSSMPWR